MNHSSYLEKLEAVGRLIEDTPRTNPIHTRFVSILSKVFYDLEKEKQKEIMKRDQYEMSKSAKHRSNQRIQRISEKMQKCYTLIK